MQNKTPKNKINKNFFKRLVCFGLVLGFLFGGVVVPLKKINAQVTTTDPASMAQKAEQFMKTWYKNIKDGVTGIFTTQTLLKFVDRFAQNMAQKIAVGMATGAKGGKPLAFTKEMGAYLEDSADAASGDYIEKLSKDWKVDLCRPDLSLQLKYGLSLYKLEKPDKPKCTFTEMRDNWEEAVRDPDLLKNFSVSFEPRQSDLGKFLLLKEDIEYEKELAKAVAERKRGNDAVGGTAPKTDKISGDITTPASKVSKISDAEVDAAIEAEKQKAEIAAQQAQNPKIGSILKSFFTTIGKTLANEVVKNYLAGTYSIQNPDPNGLWQAFCEKNPKVCGDTGNTEDSLSNPYAQDASGGEQETKAKYSKYIKTNLLESGNHDILPELSSCSDSTKPGPSTCVIDDNFAQAVREEITVREALEKGLLDGDRVFGYRSNGDEIFYTDGYPYRSLLILRKYRIIPVGWELAAQFFINYRVGLEDAPTLNTLIAAYNDTESPYYRLVDPNWVLKLPSGYCMARGNGPEILYEQINPGSDMNDDGDWNDINETLPSMTISRNDQYCAAEQSCIKENIDGTCEYYGYCMEEKRLWRFEGDRCDEINNTCQAFVSSDGKVASYLKNSLDWDDCSIDNSGCQWYGNEFNIDENSLVSGGTIAYWSMDALSKDKTKVVDEAGSSTGDIRGDVSLVTGKWGKALTFDGADDYVEVPTNSVLELKDNFTLELWLRTTTSTIGSEMRVIDKQLGANPNGYFCTVRSNRWNCRQQIDGVSTSSVSFTEINDGKWHHLAWKIENRDNQYLYVDGIREDSDVVPSHPTLTPSGFPFFIGINDGLTDDFNGQLDELVIYDRALSDEEIWDNYISYSSINNDDKIYLSDSAEACDGDDSGCNHYLVPESGLVGYWQFDKGSDLLAYDSSGYENEGALINDPIWTVGYKKQALDFDGADDYVVGTSVFDDIDFKKQPISIEAWIRPAAGGSDYEGIFYNGASTGTNYGIELNYDPINDRLGLAWHRTDGNTAGRVVIYVTSVSDYISTNSWHHIAAVYDGSGDPDTDNTKLYIDANARQDSSSVTTLSSILENNFYIGGSPDPNTRTFTGTIDEVAIYDRVLSEQEVFAIYNNGINFTDKFVKAANRNMQCFGRTASDAIFDLPSFVDNCISLGARYDSYGYDSCFEFLHHKNEDDCVAGNGVWSSLPIKVSRHTVQSYCEKSGAVWNGSSCETQCLKLDDLFCSDYAFSCKESEVGCEKYTPTQGGSWVPGVISDADLCPYECAGYDTYKQEATNFETSSFPVNFIPATANSCSSNSAGCDEFTNLEALESGGESLEYYTYLRQCEKVPTASATYNCGNFYTWVGSDTTGYQLQSYYLKSTGVGLAEDPLEILRVEEDLGDCNDANDALTNKNCKEFYNSEGAISYHLLKKTITCSNECTEYRKTLPAQFDLSQVCKNIGGTWASPNCNINSEQACNAIDEVWSSATSTCSVASLADNVLCSNPNYLDAVWDAVALTCSKVDYKAIPSEGLKCSAPANGCREYTGNAGANIMSVFNDDFESDSYLYDFADAGTGWQNGSLSSESTDSDQKSFKVDSGMAETISKWLSAECSLPASCTDNDGCDCLESDFGENDGDGIDEKVCTVWIDQDSCMVADYTYDKGIYLLSFWAKGNNGNKIVVKITDGVSVQYFGENIEDASVTLSDQWREYTLGPVEFDVKDWDNYQLNFEDIKSNGGTPDSALAAFFDNVKLEAVSDSIYIIKDSWNTPASCDQDWNGNSYLYYMLGCDEYFDSKGSLHYLKSFTNLCRADAVGCEKLINTHNYSNPFLQAWHLGDASEITVPAYNFAYLAQTQEYSCASSSAGCTALGKPKFNQDKTIVKGFDTVYKINDPDDYDVSLCYEKNVGCETFTSGTEQYFMKDPKNQVCEYIQPTYEQEHTWYKKSDSYDIDSEKCPISDYQNFGIDFPSGTCVGGVENGKDCLPGWDNYLEKQCTDSGGSCDISGACSTVGSCLSVCSDGGGYCGSWAGACVPAQSGCSAFVDPLSDSSINLVSNNLFNKDLDGDLIPDDWLDGGGLLSWDNLVPGEEHVNVFGDGLFFQGDTCYLVDPCEVGFGCNCTLGAESCIVPNGESSCVIPVMSIEPNTTYTLSADIQRYDIIADDALVRIECLHYSESDDVCPLFDDEGFYFIDDAGSLSFSPTGLACPVPIEDRAELIISDADLLTDDFTRHSMRFFSGTCNQIQLSLGSIGAGTDGVGFDNIALQETGVYYYLDGSLDDAKRECNGYVNSEQGCVLLNNRNKSSWSDLDFTSHLVYNADDGATTPTKCTAPDGSKLLACNADTLLKVKPDRDCGKWLYCSNLRVIDDENQCCAELGICDKMNEKGECINNPLEYSDSDVAANMTFDISNIDKIKNLTGYSKVGFDWLTVGGKLDGNLPPSQMGPVGTKAALPNGDFEFFEKECTVDGVVDGSGDMCATDDSCTDPETCEVNKIRPTDWNRIGECSSSETPCISDTDCPLGANELCDPDTATCKSNIFCDFHEDCPSTGAVCAIDADCFSAFGTANGGSTTTLVDTSLTQPDDYWNGKGIIITGTLDGLAPEGEFTTVTDFDLATNTLTFAAPLTADVEAWDTYALQITGESCNESGLCTKTCNSLPWSFDAFNLVNNPVEAQQISIDVFGGSNFLRLNAGSENGTRHALSDNIYVMPSTDSLSTEYVLSGYINTKDFGPTGDSVFGVIQVLEVNDEGSVAVIAEERVAPRSQDLPRDSWKVSDDGWVFVQMFFTTSKTSGVIKVKLGDMMAFSKFCDICSGSIYFDNITISPVLHAQEPITNKQPLVDCRLYPESESVKCEYMNEDGYKYKGWYGYCLEHDPLYPEYCLNWYPVNTLDGAMSICFGECVYADLDEPSEDDAKFDACVFE